VCNKDERKADYQTSRRGTIALSLDDLVSCETPEVQEVPSSQLSGVRGDVVPEETEEFEEVGEKQGDGGEVGGETIWVAVRRAE